MARPTIAELSGFADLLSNRIDGMRQEITDLWAANEKFIEQLQAAREEAVRQREESRHVRSQLDEVREKARTQDAVIAELRQENALLRQQLQEHIARYQESDRRRWGLILLLVGTVLSLASGLIVTLARK